MAAHRLKSVGLARSSSSAEIAVKIEVSFERATLAGRLRDRVKVVYDLI